MTKFLLDQNVNKKSLAASCTRQGLVGIRRFPEEWREYPGGFKDPELLQLVMAKSEALLTNDRDIAKLHVAHIPPVNPGIVIVGFPRGYIRPMKKGDLERVLASFKKAFNIWHTVSWSNSISEITNESAAVWHVARGELIHDLYVPFADATWTAQLQIALAKNALSTLLGPVPLVP